MSDTDEIANLNADQLLAEHLPRLSGDQSQRLPAEVVDLLHCLGFVYLRHGQANRAVVLLMLASRAEPERGEILRTLAAAMIGAGLGDQAETVLERLCALDPAAAGHRMVALMRARALLLQGRTDEARAMFREDVAP